jgi:hypothetical protein
VFRNIIDLMTEFSVGKLIMKGGSKKSRALFKALNEKINMPKIQDMFFREYYRSGNVFFYRFDAELEPEDVRSMTETFAEESPKTSEYIAPNLVNIQPEKLTIEPMKIPARYIVLNPADIQMMSTLNFAYGIYFKILTDYEIAMLRNPQTPNDVAVFNDLPKEVQKQIKTGSRVIAIPLDPKKVSMVFYKKQDYEPFAVPMGYPVLEDINFKAELRKIDMAISRTMQQIILLVTAGAEPDKGGVNQKYIESLRKLFQNQSVGRVLIADYTTKADFVIPKIAELLDPKKYEVVNNDINMGLNNVFAGSEKFANQQQKVEIFITRLEQGRKAFINDWLIIEMKRICKSLNIKQCPTPEFEPIQLKDQSTLNKIYGRLMEVGVLTAEQGLKALESGSLPDYSLLEEDQKEYKKQRDAGLYVPLIGGPKDATGKNPADTGRPTGAKSPQITKKISPIGTSKASEQEQQYSVTKVRDNLALAQELEKSVGATLREMHGIKKMSRVQKDVCVGIVELIMANEEPSKWMESVKSYCGKPEDRNHERVLEVNKIATTHQLDNYLASALLASKVEHGQ